MVRNAPRPPRQRKADTLAMLGAANQDVWVATASTQDGSAHPHLVPVSLAWVDERVVIAVDATSPTARNIAAAGSARLAVGPTRDVVMIDAQLADTVPVADSGTLGDAYAQQADWDPRTAGGAYQYLVLTPRRIQAWREADEIPGRTLMRAGAWLV